MKELKKYYRAEAKCNSDHKIVEREMYSQGNWFLTKEEAKADFLRAYEIAENKYNKLLSAFSKIREELDIDFCFDYYMEGDTYGIYESGCYISFRVNGYEFKFLQ